MLSYIDINCVLSSIKPLHVDLLCLLCDVTTNLWRMWRECNGGSGGHRGRVFLVKLFSFPCSFRQKICQTSMHSSRMRTARLLPVSPCKHCSQWRCLLPGGCVSQHALRQTPPREKNHRHV